MGILFWTLALLFPVTGECLLGKKRQSSVAAGDGDTLLTGILCREPGQPGEKDAEVILNEGNQRELAFSKLVVENGVELGREAAGIQTTVQCKGPPPPHGCNPDPVNPPLCSSPKLVNCTCEMDEKHLPPLPYQKKMLAEASQLCEKSNHDDFRVLMIGLGGGAMPTFLRQNCSKAVIDSIEPDARMISIAQRFLGFTKGERDVVEKNDGLLALQKRVAANNSRYDLVLVDCFDGGHIPEACRSLAFVSAVYGVVNKASGTLLQNALFPAADDLMKFYGRSFGAEHVNTTLVSQAVWGGTNHSQRIIQAWT